jgi:hypothetical protein
MQIAHVLRTFGGGLVVYVVTAACGSSGGGETASTRDGGQATDGQGIVDAIVNPVTEAAAADSTPSAPVADVAEEPCNKRVVVDNLTLVYAEHAYPGRSIVDLGRVDVVYHFPVGVKLGLPGFADLASKNVFLKPELATAPCGQEATTANIATSVTFILPP